MNHKIPAAALLLWPGALAHAQTLTPNTWTLGAPMPTPRSGAFTGVIGNKIYLVGGVAGSSIVNVNEIYDTASNSWTSGAALPTTRQGGASAVLNNILYAIGGANNGQLNVVEAYDPVANAWSTKASLPYVLDSMQAAVENNLIYVVGGYNGNGGRLTSMLSYNPATNAWSQLQPLNIGKSYSAVALLGNTIVSAGGLGNSGVINDTESYNATNNSWAALSPMPTARQAACYGVIGQQFFVAGGDSSGTTLSALSVMEAYNSGTNSWTTGLPALLYPEIGPASAVVNGHLYCIGGGNATNPATNYVQIFDPPAAPPSISSGGVISASGFGGFASISPGSWIEIYGSSLAADTRGWTSADFNGNNAPTSLDGTTVTVGGQSAFISYISPGQVNALVPSTVPRGQQQIIVTTGVGASAAYGIMVNAAEPGLLATPQFKVGGLQYAVAFHTDGTFILPVGAIAGLNSRPAQPGETITFYGVGFGPVTPSIPAGQLAGALNTLSLPLLMEIGGVPAATPYDGLAPSFTGLYQFNVTVPAAPSGNQPLTFTLNGIAGAQTLYIALGQ
ncbi:MAG: hypothetical protein JO323_15920 [Acidobacteriia bacterium]|nr:hypothetical protein [Terriglobia bacterium]